MQLDEMKKRALELLEQGESGNEIQRKIKEEFNAQISCSWLYSRVHARDGTEPKKKTTKKKKQEKPVALATKTINIQSAPLLAHGVDALLGALLRAMRAEGVDSVMLRADGRATVYHVVSRELQIS